MEESSPGGRSRDRSSTFELSDAGLTSRTHRSDNPITRSISATDASKGFADLLDAVEHRGESFTVVRRGRAVATIAPAGRATVAELRAFVRAHPPGPEWDRHLEDIRRLVGPAATKDPWSV